MKQSKTKPSYMFSLISLSAKPEGFNRDHPHWLPATAWIEFKARLLGEETFEQCRTGLSPKILNSEHIMGIQHFIRLLILFWRYHKSARNAASTCFHLPLNHNTLLNALRRETSVMDQRHSSFRNITIKLIGTVFIRHFFSLSTIYIISAVHRLITLIAINCIFFERHSQS